jgi:hypothetical protein
MMENDAKFQSHDKHDLEPIFSIQIISEIVELGSLKRFKENIIQFQNFRKLKSTNQISFIHLEIFNSKSKSSAIA